MHKACKILILSFIVSITHVNIIASTRKFKRALSTLYNEETQNNADAPFIIVSLGCNCDPAFFAQKFQIRTYALPFDWCLTPYNALYRCIQSDFAHYFKHENLVALANTYVSDCMIDFLQRLGYSTFDGAAHWVFDQEIEMIFAHDFSHTSPSIINTQYAHNYDKYSRRIKRFLAIKDTDKHLYFIRHQDITQQEACELYQLLQKKFPNTHFTLIVTGNSIEEFDNDWHISGIKNFYASVTQDECFWHKIYSAIRDNTLS